MSYKNTNVFDLKANNDMSAKDIFINRALYSGFAFSEAGEVNFEPWSTKNFWFLENLFYGRIREVSGEISVIRPKSEFFQSCRRSNVGRPVQALDFVADAFEHFLVEHEKNRIQGRIVEGSEYLTELSATKGAVDCFARQDPVMAELNKNFISYSKLLKERANKIFSFDEFVPFFMEFLVQSLLSVPVTRSSYLVSRHSTPLTSGLCLEIGDLKHSKDEDKSKHFLNDKNFHIYRHIAAGSGFAIDKNAPWRLVADISSKKMIEFASAKVPSISSAEDILDYYYENVIDVVDEFEEFKRMTVRFYNTFNISMPTVSEKEIDSGRKVSTRLKRRKREPFEDIVARFENDFWYDKFVRVKNIELGLGYSENEISSIAKNAKDLESSLDRGRATGYLKKRMTPIVSSEGSLSYEAFKLKKGNAKESAKKNAQALARSLNKKIY